MAFTPPYDVDPNPASDTVKEGVLKNDGNIGDIYDNLNLLLSMIESVPATGEEILQALYPVDGLASELDCKFLGGVPYSEYARVSHSHPLATNSTDGFMSYLDKQKLTGIPIGAEINVQSDWDEASSSSDAFIRNKPKFVGTNGIIEHGDTAVFSDSTNVEGKSVAEMKSFFDFFQTVDFVSTSAGAADAGKPITLDPTGLIHASIIPAVPAEAIWGGITGTLINQTDLQAELDAKLNLAGGECSGDVGVFNNYLFVRTNANNPGHSGGWARGLELTDFNGDRLGAFGAAGDDDQFHYLYIGIGSSPHNNGFKLMADGKATLDGPLEISAEDEAILLSGQSRNFIRGLDETGTNLWFFGRGNATTKDISFENYAGSLFRLPEGGGATIDGEQIYTDAYHPAITALLLEIDQLKQRITALGG